MSGLGGLNMSSVGVNIIRSAIVSVLRFGFHSYFIIPVACETVEE